MRKTFTTRLLSRGAAITDIQHLLGHASVKTTEKAYAAFVKNERFKQTIENHAIRSAAQLRRGKALWRSISTPGRRLSYNSPCTACNYQETFTIKLVRENMIISTKSMQGIVLGLSLLTGGLLLPGPGSATVILTDDADFGPNTVIRDVDNARDFLRLDFTTPYTYEEIIYITEVGLAGDFEGWRVASQAQLEALGVSAGIAQGSIDPTIITRANELRDWFCASCVRNTSTHVTARGLLRDSIIAQPDGVDEIVQISFSIGERLNVEPHEAGFRTSGWGRDFWRGEQIFLVRDEAAAVPESVAFALCSYGNYHPSCWWYHHWEPGLLNPRVYGWFPYPRPYSYGGYHQPIYGWFPYPHRHSYGGYRQPVSGW